LNLLYLVHRIPYPPNKGDKIRSWNELRYLGVRHRVHLGCLADQKEDLAHLPALQKVTASCEVAPLDARWARIRSLGALAGTSPLSVQWFQSAQLQRWVAATVQRERFDAVLLFSSPMAEYVRDVPVPMVMDFCDVDSDKWRQYATRAPLPLRPIYALEARRLRLYEEEILGRCAAATLVAERERALWTDLPLELRSKVHVVPNGVDLDWFVPQGASASQPNMLVFTGAMDYYANVDAVVHFATEVLPRIRAVVPNATFAIVGSRPAPAVQALARRPGIVVTGFVDDIRTWYARAALCVVPLRIARGIQNKVLEAMAMGRPVLATTAAAEGLGAHAGNELRVADDPEALSREAIALLGDRERAEAMGIAARQFVEREYVWERAMGTLERLLEDAAARRRPRRGGTERKLLPAELVSART
jgi:sugar transferase (PEP-CTERM/EpsH1 system associated)